jgi:hypothetical protein
MSWIRLGLYNRMGGALGKGVKLILILSNKGRVQSISRPRCKNWLILGMYDVWGAVRGIWFSDGTRHM